MPGSTEEAGSEKDVAKRFQQVAKRAAEGYEVTAEGDPPPRLTAVAEPLLRWTNPLGGQGAHGEIYLWTRAGIPAAILSINEFVGRNGRLRGEHEWCSLSDVPLKVTGTYAWAPQRTDRILALLDRAPPPADSPARRLRQMREFTARFAGEKTTRAGEKRPLRVLPQPLYRYQSTDPKIVDGGLFALVEATDPEALLILEARSSGAAPKWQYALVRMNSLRVVATCDDKLVWEAERLAGPDIYERADKAYAAFLEK
jgi:hypothetical protein